MQDRELRETVIKGETIYDGRIIKVEKWAVRLPNGLEAEREVVLHNGAAAIVPVDRKGYVTLVRQYRVAIGRLMLEIPAGKVDYPGEDPFDCARRELEEETGLKAGKWQKMAHVVTTPGFCTERIALYLATELTQDKQHTDPDEFLSLVRMPLSDAVAKVLQGEIEDAKSCLGLLLAQKALGEPVFMRQDEAVYIPRRQDFYPQASN